MLEAACLFLAGERLNIRVGVWEACKALSLAPASGEEASIPASNLRLESGEDALRVATNLAMYNLVRRDKDDLQVTTCHFLFTSEYRHAF